MAVVIMLLGQQIPEVEGRVQMEDVDRALEHADQTSVAL